MKVRAVDKNEYAILAGIHQKAFENFFLTTLGLGFLKTYYKASLNSSESVAICAVNEENQIIGFCIGCILSKGYHKRLVKSNFTEFLFQGVSILFTKPKALYRLLFNLDKSSNKTDDGNYAELLSIGVLPETKNTGIGKEMIKKFEEALINKGCKKIALTTDFSNNQKVLEFYKKTGYEILCEFTTYPNRRMYKLIKNFKT
jgi:ribosomal protein S18 acetylase RimI-like enzyme